MRRGAAISGVLHVVLVLFVFFGVPRLFAPEDTVMDRPIPVELYTVADETTLPQAAPEPEPKPEPEPVKAPPPPEPVTAARIPPPPPEPIPEPVPTPEPLVEAAPLPPEPAPVETKPVETKPVEAPPPPPPKPVQVAKPKPKPKALPPPAAKPKPPPEPEPPPEPDQNFASLLKNLAAEPAKETPSEKPVKAKPKPVEPPVEPAPTRVVSTRDQPLSLSVIDAIRRQVEDKWSVPVGARDAAGLEVEIRIVLQPDGTVTDARIVDRARLAQPGEEFFRTVAESAVRAVRRASPLRNLPPQKYDQWREITFRFKPPA